MKLSENIKQTTIIWYFKMFLNRNHFGGIFNELFSLIDTIGIY